MIYIRWFIFICFLCIVFYLIREIIINFKTFKKNKDRENLNYLFYDLKSFDPYAEKHSERWIENKFKY